MRKKKKISAWKYAAVTFLLGAALCTTGCGSKEETLKKEDVAQQETADTETAKAESTPTEKPEATPTEKPENTPTEAPESTPTPIPGIEFPYKAEEDKLVIESLFQLSSINPDCNDEIGDNAASVQVENASEEYLESADITVLLHDGTEFKFHLEDVPAGKKVLAFDTENQVYDRKSGVKEITAEAEYSAEETLLGAQVTAGADEAGLKVENISDESLENLTVTYHCLFEEMYYGGRSYSKTVESLAPGESIVIDTPECYLGEAAAVNISK